MSSFVTMALTAKKAGLNGEIGLLFQARLLPLEVDQAQAVRLPIPC